MTIDNVPCAICDKRVYLDDEHVKLTAEFRASARPDDEFIAHVQCVDDLDAPEP